MPKSNKLLKLMVDIGSSQRQIVSGIAKDYSPEEMLGKHVIVIVNLKPTKLMGIESAGMVLCGDKPDGGLYAHSLEALSPGTRLA